jgi:CDP-2,3-bis-(O-geranylgeranyl)-sn-glycerol synthase
LKRALSDEEAVAIHLWAIVQMSLLLAVANGAPVIATRFLGSRYAWALDAGTTFVDGRPLFGRSKTLRGVMLAMLASAVAAPLLGLSWTLGIATGSAAMAGDLFSSFVKRRINLPPSSRATGLDQVPESLLPLLVCRGALALSFVDIVIGVAIFFVGDVVLSVLLYEAHIRDRPY